MGVTSQVERLIEVMEELLLSADHKHGCPEAGNLQDELAACPCGHAQLRVKARKFIADAKDWLGHVSMG